MKDLAMDLAIPVAKSRNKSRSSRYGRNGHFSYLPVGRYVICGVFRLLEPGFDLEMEQGVQQHPAGVHRGSRRTPPAEHASCRFLRAACAAPPLPNLSMGACWASAMVGLDQAAPVRSTACGR